MRNNMAVAIIPDAVDEFDIAIVTEYVTSHEKFTAEDMYSLHRAEESRPMFEMLRGVVYDWLYNYKGNFDFVVNMKREYLMRGQLSMRQAAGVVNSYRADALYRNRQLEFEKVPNPAVVTKSAARTIEAKSRIDEGIYTIGTDSSGSDHITIRIVPHWDEDEAAEGKQVAKFLAGPDNQTMYTGFAFVDGTKIIVWKRYRDNERVVNALAALMAGSTEERHEMGYAYAAKSNRCWKCGKPLTVPASQMAGLGPICYGKVFG
jgi:hypothetical protein